VDTSVQVLLGLWSRCIARNESLCSVALHPDTQGVNRASDSGKKKAAKGRFFVWIRMSRNQLFFPLRRVYTTPNTAKLTKASEPGSGTAFAVARIRAWPLPLGFGL